MPQFPFVQDGLPLTDEHILPQAPQLLTSLVVLISQPSARLPLQFANPVVHVIPQAEDEQIATPLIPGGQVMPHPPQL